MSVFRDERDLAVFLARDLVRNEYRVCLGLTLIPPWRPPPPSCPQPVRYVEQPEIDMLIIDKNSGAIHAVELKYFRLVKKGERVGLNYPFYSGLDEALALLRFGFERVSLWHAFDQGIPADTVQRYLDEIVELIRGLKMPIGYRAFEIGSQSLSGGVRVLVDLAPPQNPLYSHKMATCLRDVAKMIIKNKPDLPITPQTPIPPQAYQGKCFDP